MLLNKHNPKRRDFLIAGVAAVSVASLPIKAAALSESQAVSLINKVVAEVLRVINSGKGEAQMLAEFENLFRKYSDVTTIARYCLGAPWNGATSAQQRAYIPAFQHYLSYKYGKQFRAFSGAEMNIVRSRDAGRLGMLVETVITTSSQAPFVVDWNVSDRSGSPKFVNLIIEGISLLTTERAELGALLEAYSGDMDKLNAKLNAT